MIKLSYNKLKKEIDFINNTIHEINSIEIIKNRIENELSLVIDPNVVKAIFNGEKEIFSLRNEEMVSFLDLLYKNTKDQRFNPSNYKITAQEVNIRNAQQKMYNPEFKEKFLEEHAVNGKSYSDETKRVVRSLFSKIGKLERYNEQDIYEFNRHSFEAVLEELGATTIRSLQSSISSIEQYINFAIEKKKIDKAKGNVASKYNKKEDISRFLNKEAEENMIFTKGDIDALAQYAENAQDGVILPLIFDGISHKNRFLELRNIRIQDCDFNEMVINIPQLTDEETGEIFPPRQVPISNTTKRMVQRAMDFDEKYVSTKADAKTSRKYKIAESSYILRGLRNNYQIKWENVSQRILRIADINDYPYLNATNIAYSGQIHFANKLMVEEGLTIDESCSRIIKRFNIGENESAHYYLKARIEKANRFLNK
ncbi:hypothetical protein KM925_08340 [Priestia megaterium]|uniref:phage lytic cycle repressor MrpR family protein n=1 Tax=Priestia megaterium TaxID=1404 RepID=UPI001C21E42A|nr:hypothetical protein [Priestia megaterium]MBU8585904.1 hypothetical protein [Priestia megaterium]